MVGIIVYIGGTGAKVIKNCKTHKKIVMKVFEALKIGRELLKMLHDSCIKIEDCRYIGLYDDYLELVGKGHKKAYVVAVLSERYGISERKVWKILSSFGKDCTIGAA
jgi:hypothetical protein